uniref:Uncharacterized protein n=1 Tax=Cucumis melo TaxID=3656 RepID=A0A9I9EBB3_CUCME
MAAMARASSDLQYPDRFYIAASYAGFDGSLKSSSRPSGLCSPMRPLCYFMACISRYYHMFLHL